MPRLLTPVICALLALVLATGTAFAVPKTDVVTLPNGDRVTCEIKGMAYGKLTAKTADMGTIAIKWDKIESIRSDYWFRLRTRDGRLLYGQIRDTEWPRTVRVVFGERETVVPLADVVEIVPIRKEFWDKFNISIAAGYNWTQANRQGRANFDLGLGYGGRIWAWGLNTSFIFSEVEDRDPYRRLDSTLFLQRVISGRWFGLASGNAQRNDELGLVLRVTGALSVGYYLIQSTHHELQLTGGISQNREWAAADDLSEDSLEAPIRLQYKVFRYDSPKTDVLVRGGYMPNLTQKGRYRFDADIAARQEIVADLFVELRYYVNFDSRPPPGALSRQDRGVTFAVGWSK